MFPFNVLCSFCNKILFNSFIAINKISHNDRQLLHMRQLTISAVMKRNTGLSGLHLFDVSERG